MIILLHYNECDGFYVLLVYGEILVICLSGEKFQLLVLVF